MERLLREFDLGKERRIDIAMRADAAPGAHDLSACQEALAVHWAEFMARHPAYTGEPDTVPPLALDEELNKTWNAVVPAGPPLGERGAVTVAVRIPHVDGAHTTVLRVRGMAGVLSEECDHKFVPTAKHKRAKALNRDICAMVRLLVFATPTLQPFRSFSGTLLPLSWVRHLKAMCMCVAEGREAEVVLAAAVLVLGIPETWAQLKSIEFTEPNALARLNHETLLTSLLMFQGRLPFLMPTAYGSMHDALVLVGAQLPPATHNIFMTPGFKAAVATSLRFLPAFAAKWVRGRDLPPWMHKGAAGDEGSDADAESVDSDACQRCAEGDRTHRCENCTACICEPCWDEECEEHPEFVDYDADTRQEDSTPNLWACSNCIDDVLTREAAASLKRRTAAKRARTAAAPAASVVKRPGVKKLVFKDAPALKVVSTTKPAKDDTHCQVCWEVGRYHRCEGCGTHACDGCWDHSIEIIEDDGGDYFAEVPGDGVGLRACSECLHSLKATAVAAKTAAAAAVPPQLGCERCEKPKYYQECSKCKTRMCTACWDDALEYMGEYGDPVDSDAEDEEEINEYLVLDDHECIVGLLACPACVDSVSDIDVDDAAEAATDAEVATVAEDARRIQLALAARIAERKEALARRALRQKRAAARNVAKSEPKLKLKLELKRKPKAKAKAKGRAPKRKATVAEPAAAADARGLVGHGRVKRRRA